MPKKIALVLATFHNEGANIMLMEAEQAAKERAIEIAAVVKVPGAMEIPLATKRVLRREEIDGAVVLGIIERGETRHGMVMGQAVIGSLIALQLETMKPVGVGILGPEIFPSQISMRLRPYGRAAVEALHHMLSSGSEPIGC